MSRDLYVLDDCPNGYGALGEPDRYFTADDSDILAQPCVVVLKQLLAEALVELREHDCEAKHHTRNKLRERIAAALEVPDPVTNDPRERA